MALTPSKLPAHPLSSSLTSLLQPCASIVSPMSDTSSQWKPSTQPTNFKICRFLHPAIPRRVSSLHLWSSNSCRVKHSLATLINPTSLAPTTTSLERFGQPPAINLTPLSITSTDRRFSSRIRQIGENSVLKCKERSPWCSKMPEFREDMTQERLKSTWVRLGKRSINRPDSMKAQSRTLMDLTRRPWRLSQRLQTREMERRWEPGSLERILRRVSSERRSVRSTVDTLEPRVCELEWEGSGMAKKTWFRDLGLFTHRSDQVVVVLLLVGLGLELISRLGFFGRNGMVSQVTGRAASQSVVTTNQSAAAISSAAKSHSSPRPVSEYSNLRTLRFNSGHKNAHHDCFYSASSTTKPSSSSYCLWGVLDWSIILLIYLILLSGWLGVWVCCFFFVPIYLLFSTMMPMCMTLQNRLTKSGRSYIVYLGFIVFMKNIVFLN
ncbi:hypothetical protein SAY87_024265 [Trapa incisa]|uniref:Uncharacterized protein n=1 Tax=Trapa incisa TaxID=236973 RepID=A0AAN7JFB9_9MYRT|nr:hypothetical protein SAY87_024265 [Trapa incisa]